MRPDPSAPPATTPASAAYAPGTTPPGFFGRAGWVLFDWASQPFYALVSTFFFAPYFASAVIADPVRGQALWGYAAATAGIIIAVFSPILGAVADRRGGVKGWMAVLSVIFIASQAMLWLATPAAPAFIVAVVFAAVVLATVTGEIAANFNNSLLASMTGGGQIGRLSGLGWALGYTGGLVSLFIMAGLIITDGSGKTLFGFAPLLPLNVDMGEPSRFTGPFSALWYAVFIIPYFLFTPDAPRIPGIGFRRAIRDGLASLASTFAHIRSYGDIALFLAARMIFIDGLNGVFIFGGIYGVSVFGWQAFQLGLFGIVITFAGAVGCVIGGFLDDRFGAKPVIMVSLMLLFAGALGVLSIDRGHILFVIDAPYAKGGTVFGSAGEQAFIAFAVLIGAAAGPLQASCRSLMARMAPRDRMAEFFGLFAFSGKATAFAAPLAVAATTDFTGDQRLGIASLLVFILLGFALMAAVKPRYRS